MPEILIFSPFQKQLSSYDSLPDKAPIMTSEEILLCYWKISVSCQAMIVCEINLL